MAVGYTDQSRQNTELYSFCRFCTCLFVSLFVFTQELVGIEDGYVEQAGQRKDQSEAWGKEMLE